MLYSIYCTDTGAYVRFGLNKKDRETALLMACIATDNKDYQNPEKRTKKLSELSESDILKETGYSILPHMKKFTF